MAKYPALPLWTDAYLGDTTHLTTEEHGAYLLLLIAAWRSPGCRLRDDDIFLGRVARCSSRVWRRIRPVIAPFWEVGAGFWTQPRLTRERNYLDDVRAKKSSAAHAKHRKHNASARADAPADAQHPTHTHSTTLKNESHTHASSPLQPRVTTTPSQASPARAATGGSRLPPDWTPSTDDSRFCLGLGWHQQLIELEAAKFVDYWCNKPGKDGLKLDWSRAWKNWCRNAGPRTAQRAPPAAALPAKSPIGSHQRTMRKYGIEESANGDDAEPERGSGYLTLAYSAAAAGGY